LNKSSNHTSEEREHTVRKLHTLLITTTISATFLIPAIAEAGYRVP
jgi:hypothetical protein